MNILIIGATSAIATATARHYVEHEQANLFLVARNEQAMDDLQQDLYARGARQVGMAITDLNDAADYSRWLDAAFTQLTSVDMVLIAHGILGNQQRCEQDLDELHQVLQANALSTLDLLTLLANRFEKQGKGTIAVISSVAGDRGRASNYVYGASKAIVTTFLQGLRARLSKVGVHVLTIKPGFVDTPMTSEFDKAGPLWAQPEDIAKGIACAVKKKKNTVYLPWFWRIIMGIIIHIPEGIFKKLNL